MKRPLHALELLTQHLYLVHRINILICVPQSYVTSPLLISSRHPILTSIHITLEILCL